MDAITNRKRIGAEAAATATAVGVAAAIELSKDGNTEGSALSDTSASADTRASGIGGGGDGDEVDNDGEIELLATSDATSVAVGLTVSGSAKGDASGSALSDASAGADAEAVGIDGGAGVDAITNRVKIAAEATATATPVAVAAAVEISKDGSAEGSALSDTSATADARASGIDGGEDGDKVDNDGEIELLATSDATSVAVGLTVAGSAKGDVSGSTLSSAGAVADATVTGIDGGGGSDEIDNLKSIVADTKSTASAVAVSADIKLTKDGDAEGVALTDARSRALATATGIDGDLGDDTIFNDGAISLMQGEIPSSDADATATAVAVSVEVAATKEGGALGAALADVGATAEAVATGIEGGAGEDDITNRQTIEAQVDADATGVAVGATVAIAKEGAALGAALADSSSRSFAAATGIEGGADGDTIENEGEIDVSADSDSDAVTVSLTVTGAKTGAALGVALTDSSSTSDARATGIGGGAGDDTLTNRAAVHADADSTSTAVAVGISGAVAKEGAAIAAALSDSRSTALAAATGIAGGAGDDTVVNESPGTIRLMDGDDVDAKATGVSVSVTVAGAKAGVAGGAAVADAAVDATAGATGIDGGGDADGITNRADITADVGAEATAVGVSAGIAAAKEGAAIAAALADTSATATARTTGIEGGDGVDEIDNEGNLDLLTASKADAVTVSVEIGVAQTGVAAGAALADSSATALSRATGIGGGAGGDTIINRGAIDLMKQGADPEMADATAQATSVSVALNGTLTGLAGGATVSDASALADSRGTGLAGGDGEDTITNAGEIAADVGSHADAKSVGVTLSFSKSGAAGGASIADSRARAESRATGIDGGEQGDTLTNEGGIDLAARSKVEGLSVAITLSGSLEGVAGGAALTDASTLADAESVGIEGGGGDDGVSNTGAITSLASSRAESTAVSLSAQFTPIGFGASVAEATSTATAKATGIAGGDDADRIENGELSPAALGPAPSSISATANTVAKGTSVSISTVGLAMGGTDNTSTATATGIDGGAGQDEVRNRDALSADASATAEGLTVSVTLTGGSLGDANTTAEAVATGIDTGADADDVENDGSISVDTRAFGEAESVSVTLAGAAAASASTTARTVATGIDGGSGSDRIVNRGAVTVEPDCSEPRCGAVAEATAVPVTLVGASLADASSAAESIATGIAGGSDDDEIENHGSVETTGLATGRSSSVSITLVGAGSANAASATSATGTGLSGGAGSDTIRNFSRVETNATSAGFAKSFDFTALGESQADATTTTSARSTGISGGSEADEIENHQSVQSTANAVGEAKGISVALGGKPNARADVVTDAEATGIDAGEGGGSITNKGGITSTASSSADVETKTFTVFGVSSSEGAITASAKAAGITGGDASDRIRNEGAVDATSTTTATTRSSSVALLGASETLSGIAAVATAVGVAGEGDEEDGDPAEGDEIDNTTTGSIEATATSTADASGDSFALGGGAKAAAFITGAAHAAGIQGSRGEDTIRNEGAITIGATSITSSGQEASVGLGGGAAAGSEMLSLASARGIQAGAGDSVDNTGSIQATAMSLGNARADSGAGFFFGDADGDAGGDAQSIAVGLELDVGTHALVNAGSLGVLSLAEMVAASKADGANFIAGDGVADSFAAAHAEGYGVRAAGGSTTIDNSGEINVVTDTTATTCDDGFGCTTADGDGAGGSGNASATASSTPRGAAGPERPSVAAGIWLEEGDHAIESSGTVSAQATSSGTGSARADGDAVGADASVTATSSMSGAAYGIRAGAGSSRITVGDSGGVMALVSTLSTSDGVTNPSADPDGDGFTTATASTADDAYAVWLEDGDHRIDSAGAIQATANSTATSDALADSDTVSQKAVANASSGGEADVYGIRVGAGSSEIISTGSISVDAILNAFAAAETNPSAASDGFGTVGASTSTHAEGYGITAGTEAPPVGTHVISNAGTLTVAARANPTASKSNRDLYAKADADAQDAETNTATTADAIAIGILSAAEQNRVTSSGELLVEARALSAPLSIAGSDTGGEADATGETTVASRATGIELGGVDNEVTNGGELSVSAEGGGSHRIEARTNGLHAAARPTSEATVTADATGVRGGIELDRISNDESISVSSTSRANSEADANAGTDSTGRARATGTSTSTALGIDAGAGDGVVSNRGSLTVSAEADADADSYADAEVFFGETEQAYATATGTARAIAIESGDGEAVVGNENAITVTADASANAYAETEDNRTESATATAEAEGFGIRTASGNDVVVNDGSISVTASATGVAKTSLSVVASAVAIDTGDGHDVIRNSGSIVTSTSMNGSVATGVGIDAGTGNDEVHLSGISSVEGRVDLGPDDDLLTLADEAAVIGVVGGGTGDDSVRIEDQGSFFIEEITENEHFLMDQGTLQLGVGVAVPASGSFRAEIYNGGFGQFLVEGTADLDGEATAIARPRVYVDGDVFPLLSAQAMQGQFASVILPPDSALVSFDSRYRFGILGRDLFEVVVGVEPFDTVATNRLQRAVARYLDQVAPGASGDLAEVLGTFQLLPAGADFDTAFTSLSPDQYDGSTLTGIDTQRQYQRGLQRRMDTARARRQLGVKSTALASLQLAMAGSSASLLTLAGALQPVSLPGEDARYTVWLDGLGQFGDQDRGNGFSGFDYSMGGGSVGIDGGFGEQFIAGLNAGYAHTDVDFDGGRGNAEIGAIGGSLYGTWFSDEARGYVEGVLSYARQSYDNQRHVVVGDLSRVVKSKHDANVFGAQLGGGYRFDLRGFGLRPFASISYVLLDEEGFTETGAGDVNLVVDGRTTHSLVSELGVRAARAFKPELGTFVPYLSGAWKYDFGIDDRTILSGFSGAPGSVFPLDGQDIDQNAALAGAGVLFLRDRWSASVEYLGEFRGDYTAHGIFARVGFSF